VETKDDYLDCLKAEIGRECGCPAYFIRTDTVHEESDGKTIWHGEVEVFGLIGHPGAKHCFAWNHGRNRNDPNGELVIALEILPLTSARRAVQAQLRGSGCG